MDDVRSLLSEETRQAEERQGVEVGADGPHERGHEPQRHAQATRFIVQGASPAAHQAGNEGRVEMGHGVERVVLRPARLEQRDHVTDAHTTRDHAASFRGRSRRDRSHSSRTTRVQIISS